MRVLDLFSGEGGASRGYHDAGFEVVGVDSNPRVGLHYPWEFHCTDALEFLDRWGHCFDAIHASPPCQAYSQTKTLGDGKHGKLVGITRQLLRRTGKPYVIENVPSTPLYGAITLCGTSFGLTAQCQDGYERQLWRHRLFECSFPTTAPEHGKHGPLVASLYGTGGGGQHRHGYKATKQDAERLMRIDWMSKKGLAQAIPPVYTEYLAGFLKQQMERTG